jgi:hypothetical protein
MNYINFVLSLSKHLMLPFSSHNQSISIYLFYPHFLLYSLSFYTLIQAFSTIFSTILTHFEAFDFNSSIYLFQSNIDDALDQFAFFLLIKFMTFDALFNLLIICA